MTLRQGRLELLLRLVVVGALLLFVPPMTLVHKNDAAWLAGLFSSEPLRTRLVLRGNRVFSKPDQCCPILNRHFSAHTEPSK